MTPKIAYRLPLIFIGGFVFQYLFWNETLGLNLLLYTVFILAITFSDSGIPFHQNKLYMALPHLAIAIYIAYNNSLLASFTWLATLLVYLGTAHFAKLKSTVTAMIWGALQIISGPYGLVNQLQATKLGKINFRPVLKPIKFIVVPLLMVVIFCSLYSVANPIFSQYTHLITNHVAYFFKHAFNFLFVDISIQKCLFIFLGLFISAGIIVGIKSNVLAEVEFNEGDQLSRKRRDIHKPSFFYDFRTLLAGKQIGKKLALKTENIIGIISFAALNLLLLLLNGIDVFTLWLHNDGNNSKNFSAGLHDGTNILIFSIIIAMVIIIYFFSGNLNFYTKNKPIKFLAYFWIIQNAFLVASVLHRDYNYIFYQGLTYKRIGVAVFALLSLIGLATVYLKVSRQKTVFFLYRTNAKIWYILLVLLSFVNWDVIIVAHNLNQSEKIGIDVDHLMGFSDKTLPILQKNRNKLIRHVAADNQYEPLSTTDVIQAVPKTNTNATNAQIDSLAKVKKLSIVEQEAIETKKARDKFNRHLNERINEFLQKQQHASWLSFSYLEWETAKILKH